MSTMSWHQRLVARTLPVDRSAAAAALIDSGFPHQHVLKAHTGCVNALALSRDPACRYLASGGDDTIVRLWDTYASLNAPPLHRFRGHRANIFCLSFSPDQRHLVSSGLDSDICLHDYQHPLLPSSSSSSSSSSSPQPSSSAPSEPLRTYDTHRAAIHRLAFQTGSPAVFFSASDDGTVGLYDTRAPDCQGLLLLKRAMHSVASHPIDGNQLLLGGRGGMDLWDVRGVQWTSPADTQRAPQAAFRRSGIRNRPAFVYDTASTAADHSSSLSAQSVVSSAVFNATGTRILATLQDYFPAVFDTAEERPLLVLAAPLYRHCVTMKGAVFAGPNDSFAVAGSGACLE
jgi:WD repeat-containing protein 22